MTAFSQAGVDPAVLQAQAQASQAKTGAPGVARSAGTSSVAKTAQDFEAMFVAQLLQPMFKGVDMSAMGGDSPGNGVYKEMLVREYGKAIAEAGGLGIADTVKQEMLRIQEQAQS
jgi:Rod binding domain-containing protein